MTCYTINLTKCKVVSDMYVFSIFATVTNRAFFPVNTDNGTTTQNILDQAIINIMYPVCM